MTSRPTHLPNPDAPDGPGAQLPRGALFVDVAQGLRSAAKLSPEVVAVIDGETTWTYSELVDKIDALASVLQQLGVVQGGRVGLHIRRSAANLAALHAVLRVGAAYVPLDINLPNVRRSLLIEDTTPAIIIVDDDRLDEWLSEQPNTPECVVVTVSTAGEAKRCVDSNGPKITTTPRPKAVTEPRIEPQDLAYIIHTSGSTGRPKGVAITHANLRTFVDSFDEAVRPPHNGRWLWMTPLSFDPSVVEVMWTLLHGATIVIAPDDVLGADVGSLIRHHSVTHLQCTPTRAHLLLADPSDRAALGSLRQLFIGGEVLRPPLADSLLATGLGRLTNLYGPTETTVWAFSYDVHRDEAPPIPIGSPLADTTALVVDGDMNRVGDGIEGELILLGNDVSPGYYGRPDITAQHFLAIDIDRVSRSAYRTGDLVRRAPNGVFTFHGRSDDQVKLRGVRIELGEVESTLEAHRNVQRAAVIVTELVTELGAAVDSRLVAFVVGSAEGLVDGSAVKAWVAERLSGPMVPTSVVVVDSLPMTSSGKIDRAALRMLVVETPPPPVPAMSRSGSLTNSMGAFDVATDMSLVLGHPLEVDDDFFDHGGHSLLAIELFARIRSRTGQRFPLRLLVDSSTPRKLAESIATQTRLDATVVVPFGLASEAQPILWIVHGAGGNVLAFRDLAKQLSREWAVVGIQAMGVDPAHEPDETMQAMVERYVEAIRRSQPDGPYLLGGYSDGGYIASHIAAHMVGEGAKVGPLMLIDAFIGSAIPHGFDRIKQVHASWTNRMGQPTGTWISSSWKAWRRRHTDGARDHDVALRSAELGYADLFDVIDRACRTADPVRPVVAIDSVVFRASEANPVMRRNYTWMSELGGRSRITFAAGDHHSILRPPNVAALGESISEALRDWR